MNRAPAQPRGELWVLAAITLCGLALRLLESTSQPLWIDEALTLIIAKWPTLDLMLRPVDPTAGLFYVLHQLLPSGAGLTTIRSISIATGTLSIPMIYVVARLAIGGRAGLLAAALLAIAPMAVDYSLEARPYALQLFLVLLSAAGLLGWTRQLGKEGGTGALVLFAVATILAFSTHLSGSFWVLPAMPLAMWATFRAGTSRQKRVFVVALVVMAIGALPEANRLIWRAQLGGGFVWLAPAGPSEALAIWSRVLLPTHRLLGGALAHLVVVVIFAVVAWRLYVHRERVRAWATEAPVAAGLIAILLLVPIFVWLFGFLLIPIFMPRTILIGLVGFILLICLADRFERRPVIGLCAVLLFSFALFVAGPVRAKEGWREITATVLKSARPGDVVVHCAKYPAFRYAAGPMDGIPSVIQLDYRMLRLDDRSVPHRDWETAYFRTTHEAPMRYVMGQKARLPIREGSMRAFRRAWVVESECGKEALTTTWNWLGEGRRTVARTAPPTEHHAGIKLWLFEPNRAAKRPVYLVTD